MVDTIGSTTGTAGSITVGGTTISSVDQTGDHDWFAINLVAGQAITVALDALSPTLDPFLVIRNSSGNPIQGLENDDSGFDLNSLLSFAAPTTGVYYIDVGAFNNGSAGDYRLTVTAFQTPPVFTNDQIANQLARGYWDGTELRFNVSSGGSLTVNLAGLAGDGLSLARSALQTWSEITGITFIETNSATPNILFTEDEPDAFTEILSENGTFVTSMHVNIDTQWLADFGNTIGSYGYMTYIHEIGHALGLGHAGNYNSTATYPYDALFQNDSWATSVMSYFDQTENTYFNSRGFSKLNLATPMVADILAVQQLYGLSTTTRSGDTTYGFNSNAGGVYDASVYPVSTVAYTIFDTGGIDTLDYSNTFTGQQLINLNPEEFSNIAGRTGNVTIARGTIIENAIGSDTRPDTIIGNSANNTLTGGGGADTLTGGAGADTFQDVRADGLNGDTITDFSAGDRIIFTDATLAGFSFSLSGTTLTYTGGSLTLTAPVVGTIIASAAASGGVQLTIAGNAIADVRNDFNGDGRSDVLWRSDAGELTNWLGQANGGFVGNGANAWFSSVPASWQVIGTGDFNGDGKDDLLWRSASGELTNWLGQANGGFVNNGANLWNTNLPSSWQVVGIGDFNGDGRDDLMWQSTSGEFSNWLGTASGGFVNNGANSWGVGPASWHIVSVGDFNGDGRDDILWRSDAGQMTNWLGQANGGFVNNGANAWNTNLPSSWQVVGTGDFNGDGRDDLMWRSTSGEYSNWLGTANGSFVNNGANSWGIGPTSWHIVGIGDYNGDGRDDLLWRSDAGEFSNWLGTANGGFTNNGANSWSVGPTSWHVQPEPDFLI